MPFPSQPRLAQSLNGEGKVPNRNTDSLWQCLLWLESAREGPEFVQVANKKISLNKQILRNLHMTTNQIQLSPLFKHVESWQILQSSHRENSH